MHPASESLSLWYFEIIPLIDVIPETSVQFVQAQVFLVIKEFQQRFPQLRQVQGPIQGSIFAGSRFRERTEAPRFLGESLHQEHYPALWESWGFQRGESWDSYELPIASGKAFFKAAGEKLQRLWQDPKIVCRSLRRKDWDQEVAAIFKITLEAYQLENTNDEIDHKIFAALSKKIRPLVEAGIVKILEYDGETVGFTICYIDIQASLRRYNERKKHFAKWNSKPAEKMISLLNTVQLIWDIKMKRHPLLLFYIAKSPRCPVKWAMTKLACSALEDITADKYPQVISALNAESSGSSSSLPPDKVFHSRHFLMTLPCGPVP
jgi:hypothetical protein